MGRALTASEAIGFGEITQDEPLLERLRALEIGTGIDLEIAGLRGRWERIADGIQPVGDMKNAWAGLRSGPAKSVDIRLAEAGSAPLATFGVRVPMWDTRENQFH